MYAVAIGQSIIQVLLFCLFIFILSIVRPQDVPALPKEARPPINFILIKRILWGIIPSLALIFLVLGTILMGLATPTEGGAMGSVGALFLAALNQRLQKDLIWQAMTSTMRINAMVIFILIGSTVFGLAFRGVDGDLWIENLLSNLPGGQVGFLFVVNLFVFFLAFFLDYFEIAFIIIPLLAPVAQKLGIDLIWFGVLLGANMQTSFMHPPFGFALFYLRGVAPSSVKSSDIYWGALPWVGLQLILVAIIIFVPETVTYFVDKPTAIIDSNAPSIDPLEGVQQNENIVDSSSEIERQLRESK
jgi:tripartite ATP-independent transporter DctM subunit